MRGTVQLLKDAWQIFLDRAWLLMGIYIVPAILALAYGFFTALMASPEAEMFRTMAMPFMLLVTIIFVSISILSGIALVRGVSAVEKPTIMEAYRFGFQYFWSYTWLGVLVGLVVLLGLVLFIIPGIIFMIWYGFANLILLFEGKKGVAAMKASKEYVRGKFWVLLGRIVVLILANLLVGLGFGLVLSILLPFDKKTIEPLANLASIVMTPFSVAYAYLLYVDVKKLATVTPAATPTPAPQM